MCQSPRGGEASSETGEFIANMLWIVWEGSSNSTVKFMNAQTENLVLLEDIAPCLERIKILADFTSCRIEPSHPLYTGSLLKIYSICKAFTMVPFV